LLRPPDLSQIKVGNTDIEGVWRFTSPTPGPSTLITALIHGNELCGALALEKWIAHLLHHPAALSCGSLTLAFCNLKAFETFNSADLHKSRFVTEDMNRVWSSDKLSVSDVNDASFERRRARELRPYVQTADYLLDLHSMHEPGDALVLTGLSDKNLQFAKSLKLPGHIIADAGHKDGIRMRDFNLMSTALLIECGFHLDDTSLDVALDCIAKFLLATRQVTLAIENPRKPPPAIEHVKAVQVTHAVVAESMTMRFLEPWKNMQTIGSKGTLIAMDGAKKFSTPYDDCTLIMPSLKQLNPGVTVVRFALNT
jgi:succinylglutamate desuccinylase